MDQAYLGLQGRVAQESQKLDLGYQFGWHKVKHRNAQGPDILGLCAVAGHDENILCLKLPYCRKLVWYAYWHL
jgi:hypothetical protein